MSFELAIAVAIRLFAVGRQKIGPARYQIAPDVLHDHGQRIGPGSRLPSEFLVLHLGERPLGLRAIGGMHPIMPFITEELWTTMTGGESLVIAHWPVPDSTHIDKDAEVLVEKMQAIITEVRRFRNDQGVKPSQKIPGRFIAPADIAEYSSAMAFLLKIELIDFTASAAVEIGSVKCELDLTGTIDVVAERARLAKDLITAQKDLKTAEVKLGNEGFMAKAPAEVVVEIRERLARTSVDIERITSALSVLK